MVYTAPHYTIVHYKVLPKQGFKRKPNAKHWLTGKNFLGQKVFFLSTGGYLDKLSTQKSNQNDFEKPKLFLDHILTHLKAFEVFLHSFVRNIFIISYYATSIKVRIWLDHFG